LTRLSSLRFSPFLRGSRDRLSTSPRS
jgi:hypothetical protein